MNIKEHIEAGHYPTDKYGFPEVPREAGTVSIFSTNGPKPEYAIVGGRRGGFYGWDVDGNPHLGFDFQGSRLLPPPPRKVEVKGWAMLRKDGAVVLLSTTKHGAKGCRDNITVELTGSYEEEWT